MKQIKSKLLIFFVFIICLIPITKAWAVSKKTPINVKWECDKDSCNKEKHIANIRIKPIGNAPISDDLFEIKKDGSIFFEPDFNKAGKYEYLIYQENKDIKDDKSDITYDKTVYRLVYVVQQGPNGLEITVYAFDNDKYEKDPTNTVKISDITFINKCKTKEGDKPDKPDTPDNPDEPDKPDKPDKPDTPDNPDKPDKPDKPNQPNKPHKPKDNKTSHDNVKTGVGGLGGVCTILISAAGAVFATRKKNK